MKTKPKAFQLPGKAIKGILAGIFLPLLFLQLHPIGRKSDDPVPEMTRLTNRVWICRLRFKDPKRQGNAFPVIVSRDGLVIVDTPLYPSWAKAAKAAIISNLGRNDFIYVINTHHHWDHTCGNQFFREATIVGHVFTPIDMNSFTGDKFASFLAARRENYRKSGDAMILALHDELEREFQATPPEKTFQDWEIIKLSDLRLVLYHTGRDQAPVSLYNHTRSDIFVYIPEEKVLCAGDVYYKKEWLEATPDKLPSDLFNGFFRYCLEKGYIIEHVVFGHDPVISKTGR